jgi:hypothetical protein
MDSFNKLFQDNQLYGIELYVNNNKFDSNNTCFQSVQPTFYST